MSQHELRRHQHIADACSHFHATSSEVKRLLTTKCVARLGISFKKYAVWSRALDVMRDYAAQKEDKRQLLNDREVKAACKQLKISKETLVQRLTTGYVPLVNWKIVRLRRILSIHLDVSARRLANRTPEVKQHERKIAELFLAGNTYREIAYAVGTTMGTIITKVNRLRFRGENIPLRPPGGFKRPSGFTPRNIGSLLRSGMSCADIAKKFNKKHMSMVALIGRWRYTYPEANIPYLQKS
jgi:transposase